MLKVQDGQGALACGSHPIRCFLGEVVGQCLGLTRTPRPRVLRTLQAECAGSPSPGRVQSRTRLIGRLPQPRRTLPRVRLRAVQRTDDARRKGQSGLSSMLDERAVRAPGLGSGWAPTIASPKCAWHRAHSLSTVAILPPTCTLRSSSVTFKPCLPRSRAKNKPLTPPPSTITCGRSFGPHCPRCVKSLSASCPSSSGIAAEGAEDEGIAGAESTPPAVGGAVLIVRVPWAGAMAAN